jgi:hypothetical protein
MAFRRGGAGKRRDAIEPAVIQALKACGVEVWQISGTGLPDLLCKRRGRWTPLEVKSGEKAPLTAIQAAEHAFPVVRSVQDALEAIGVAVGVDASNRLCKAKFLLTGRYCTREHGHDGDHVATIGPYTPTAYVLARWSRELSPAVDTVDPRASSTGKLSTRV